MLHFPITNEIIETSVATHYGPLKTCLDLYFRCVEAVVVGTIHSNHLI